MDGFLLISEQLFGSPVVDKEKKYTCMRIYISKVVIHNNLMVQALQMLSLLEHVAQEETVIESLLCIAASSRHARGLLLIPTLSEKKNQSVYGW
jgi:ABC-type iron transport system FetAB permease component